VAQALCVGNLKYSGAPPEADATALAGVQAAIAGRPVWVFASSHPGEEAQAAAIHRTLVQRWPNVLTVLVPRHPARGDEIVSLLQQYGLGTARRSRGALPEAATAVYLGDTLGEMGLYCRLGDVVAIGGSLIPHGGHNPIEAAQLGAAVLFGPHMHNFQAIAEEMCAAGAARRVADAATMATEVTRLLENATARTAMCRAGAAFTARHSQAVMAVMTALHPLLQRAHFIPAP
jgi:3-deoxy-D-manno-octulosonic-acid transferase